MTPLAARRDDAFRTWLARVEALVFERLGMRLGDFPDLPLREGFNSGDSPAEFYFGCIVDYLDTVETRPGAG